MIRAAIVGLGTWGQHLVECARGSEAIKFVAGATRTASKAAEFAQQHGIVMAGSYEALLSDPGVDAVVLATPHLQHSAQIVLAARAGKHVFTEKPLGINLPETTVAVRACEAAGVTLAVGYNWRFQPALQEIRRMLEDCRLGTLLHVEGNFCGPSAYRFPKGHWRQDRDEVPAGGMTGRGVHVVDAMLCLGGHMASVFAQSFRRAQDFGVDDTTSMLFRFRSGASAYLGTVIATAETWRLQVFGSNGWAEVGDVEHLPTWDLRFCPLDRKNVLKKGKPETIRLPAVSTERAELENFARAAQARRPLALPGGDEVHNVAVLEAIQRSVRENSLQVIA